MAHWKSIADEVADVLAGKTTAAANVQKAFELIEKNVADIFTTDVIAAVLMCSTKSNYSWDVEIKKYENKIFIDKRQDETLANNILCY